MMAEWQTKTLGEVCTFENGDRGENYPSKSVQTTTGVPFINAGHLTEFGLDFETMNYIPRERFDLLGNGKIRKNDILFCLRGSLGKFASVGDLAEGAIASSLVIVRPKESVIDAFVSAYFQSDLCASMIDRYKNGAAQPNLSAGSLKNFIIPLPPLPEQQRIVTILDEAFDGIATAKANAEKNLQNARALFESHLQSVFSQRGEGWVEKRLEQIGSTQTGSTPKSSEQGNYGDFIPFIKPADFNKDGSLDYENDGLSEQGFKTARKIAANSVLMVCIGATIGKCGWCDRDVVSNQQINAFTPTEGVSNKFIYYQMLTEDFQKRVLHSSGQATLPIINKSKWSSLTVVLPPKYAEQERIVDQFDKLIGETQHLESIYQQKLAALDALKKSLLDQAFTGGL